MKLMFLLLTLGLVNASASMLYSQDDVISLAVEDLTIKDVFRVIEELSDYRFLYNDEFIGLEQQVSLNLNESSLEDVLNLLLLEKNLSYRLFNDNLIVITPSSYYEDQPQKLTGTVTDAATGETLVGVYIIVEGTNTGVITDVAGNFTIEIPDNNVTLLISYIGYISKKVITEGKLHLDIKLSPDMTNLEEVVVIGYGTSKKRDVTGAIASVKSESIVRLNPVQPAKALQGQVAGVNVNKINSRPGSDYSIDIRGVHSISFSSEPLVVIDGVMGGKLNIVNPSDIETMDVLKDASATAIYGARGANGVIIITTKKGTQGKVKVTYDGYSGVKVPTNLPDLMTAQEFYHAYNDVVKAENPSANPYWSSAELANIEAGKSVDWVDQVTNPSFQNSHVLALSGGNEISTHYFSAGYLNEQGNLLYTGYERFNLKGSIDNKINEKVKVGFSAYYTYSLQNLGSGETLRGAYRVRPTGTVYFDELVNPAETNDKNVDGYAFWMGIKDAQVQNPILEVQEKNNLNEFRVSSFLGNGYVEITPFKDLSLKTSLSTSALNSRNGVYVGADTKGRLNKQATASNGINLNNSYTWDNILNYKNNFGVHGLNITGAISLLQERFESSGANVENLPYNSGWYALNTAGNITGVKSNLTERSILSYMGRINYSLMDKYLLTVTGRYDGSSVLAEGNKWAFFPSVALAWRAGEEQFIKNLNVFSDLKIRLSYGEVGNDVVAPYSTQAYMQKTNYDFNGAAAYGYAPKNIGNEDLKWETSKEINIGFNFGFLKSRILLDLEIYNKKTNDLIQNVALPPSYGFASVTANVGKLVNRGVEVTLNTLNVKTKDFQWSTNLNWSSNHNEILELYGGTVTRDIANRLFVGESLRSHYYYKFDGIWQLDEVDEATTYGQVPGSVKVVDRVPDGKISSAADADDRMVLGNELPDWIAGITNTFNYKNLDLSFFIYTRQGVMYRNSMLSGTMGELGSNRYNRLNLNYWTATNPTNDYFGVWQSNPYREAIQYKDASFWRVSNVTLGYNLPSRWLARYNIGTLRLYLQANNLMLFAREQNIWMDPEFNSGVYNDDVPNSTYLFGVNLSF